jgi:enoyl-CoA hydratase
MTCFELTLKDNIAHIVLNRPEKRNSMIREFWSELPDLIEDIDNNARARVIVITSTGPHFTSGIDTSLFAQLAVSKKDGNARVAFYQEVKQLQQTFTALENARLPILVAVQGGCIGGGLDFITACDMRYATKDAFFTLFETNLAMTADVGTFPRLAKLIPEGFVKEMAYTGNRFSAKDAYRFGLVNALFDTQEEMITEVMKIAQNIASKAPLAVSGCKTLINYSRDHSTSDVLDYIALWNASHFKIEDVMEAFSALQEGREGVFPELTVRGKASL